MSDPKPIPLAELKPGMVVYYKLDSAEDGGWDLSKIDNRAVVVMEGDKPMLFDLFHQLLPLGVNFSWRDPRSWTPYRTKRDADLACLREGLARHSRHVSEISEQMKKLAGED